MWISDKNRCSPQSHLKTRKASFVEEQDLDDSFAGAYQQRKSDVEWLRRGPGAQQRKQREETILEVNKAWGKGSEDRLEQPCWVKGSDDHILLPNFSELSRDLYLYGLNVKSPL